MEKNEDALLIFLGDYGDRGFHSVETYYTVLSIKLLYPKQVVLIRGNHEGPEDLMAHPHDLPEQFQTRFGEKWAEAYWKIRALFPHLYNAVLVKNRYLLAHGGLSTQMATAEDLAYAHKTHPEKRVLEDLLWSDPTDATENTCTSPRGAGQLFGQKVTTTVLERFNVEVFIRGHEPCAEGFRIDHNGKILTLFSRKGPPYFNAYGAYLNIDFSMKPKHAENMIPWLHKF
ncbi:MAG: metallophosphoesterase family protein [Candidatus Bathyarchaeia archaeon]